MISNPYYEEAITSWVVPVDGPPVPDNILRWVRSEDFDGKVLVGMHGIYASDRGDAMRIFLKFAGDS